MITENMVREGIRNGSVRFVRDPNMDHGTVCQIGDKLVLLWAPESGGTRP